MTLGFAGDPHALITTAEAAARLGYSVTGDGKPAKTWYNEAGRRRAAGFPAPVRRGLYRLGDLQAWAARGGMAQARRDTQPDRQPTRGAAPEHAPTQTHTIRPELRARLAVLQGGR